LKILFVCSANKDRSRTAEDHFRELYPEFEFESAGTNKKICDQLGTQFVTEELLDWADEILVMENKHREWIRSNSKKKFDKKIKVLQIEDIYEYGEKELISILSKQINPLLKNY
jgi:predicted protein tyrosine phosphatase